MCFGSMSLSECVDGWFNVVFLGVSVWVPTCPLLLQKNPDDMDGTVSYVRVEAWYSTARSPFLRLSILMSFFLPML